MTGHNLKPGLCFSLVLGLVMPEELNHLVSRGVRVQLEFRACIFGHRGMGDEEAERCPFWVGKDLLLISNCESEGIDNIHLAGHRDTSSSRSWRE